MDPATNGHPPVDPYATPKVHVWGEVVYVHWGRLVTLEFTRIAEHRDALTAEVVATEQTTQQRLPRAKVTLLSFRSRKEAVSDWESRAPERPWLGLLTQACELVVTHHRTPGVLEAVNPVAPGPEDDLWWIPGWMPKDEITVLFGDGGTGKSYLALAMALAGLTGHPLESLRPGPLTRVLYLDWETKRETIERRMWRLTRYREEPPRDHVLYRRMPVALADAAGDLRGQALRAGVDLVIVDSLAAASGPEPEGAEAAIRTLNALGTLPGTKVVIAHMSKAMADAPRGARPFGSVFNWNLARAVIQVSRPEPLEFGEPVELTLTHRKPPNDGRPARPVALSFAYDAENFDAVSIGSTQPDLSNQPVQAQILAHLRSGAKSATALADLIGVSSNHIRSVLSRLEKRNIVMRVVALSPGRGQKTLWGLVDTKRNT